MVDREDGFTLVELMTASFVFALVSVGFYLVLFSVADSTRTTRDVVDVSTEARLGFNRMVRDTREASNLTAASATSFTIEVDFDADGTIEAVPDDPTGSYEREIFTFDPVDGTITLSNGISSEVLMEDVDCLRKADDTCYDVFTYGSGRLEYDANRDGVTSSAELNAAPTIGNNNGVIDGDELDFVDLVSFGLRLTEESDADADTNFYADAQLRNRR